METSKEIIEKDLREKVKAEFIDLVTDLVNVNSSLKAHIDIYKWIITFINHNQNHKSEIY